jgi:hypothetical protein
MKILKAIGYGEPKKNPTIVQGCMCLGTLTSYFKNKTKDYWFVPSHNNVLTFKSIKILE